MRADAQLSGAAAQEHVRAACRAGDYRAALAVAEAAVAAPADGPARVRALVERARLEAVLGRLDDEAATLERAVATARSLADAADALGLALARLAGSRAQFWRVAEADALVDEALALETTGAVRALALVAAAHADFDGGRFDAAQARLDEARPLAEGAPDGPDRDDALLGVLAGTATLHRVHARFDAAEAVARAALAFAEQRFGPQSEEVGGICNLLGMLGKFSGRFDFADPWYARAIAIAQRIAAGAPHPMVAVLEHNLGGLEHARGNFAAAEPHARRSVAIRAAALGPDDPALALDRGALASILDALGQRDEAERLLRSAIAGLEAAFGPDNHELAINVNNLAALLYRRGELEHAQALFERSLAVKRKLLGERAPEIGSTLANLANVRRRRGDVAGAEADFRAALALMREALEPDHPNIQRTVAGLAALLRGSGRAGEADALTQPQPQEDQMDETTQGAAAEVEGHGIEINANESVVEADAEGHGLPLNANETVVEPEGDAEGHGTGWGLNENETVVEGDAEGHGGWLNANETVVEPEGDVEGHGKSLNANETVVGPQDDRADS